MTAIDRAILLLNKYRNVLMTTALAADSDAIRAMVLEVEEAITDLAVFQKETLDCRMTPGESAQVDAWLSRFNVEGYRDV
jgi:hypothetical protein